jgi:hypothetical protein
MGRTDLKYVKTTELFRRRRCRRRERRFFVRRPVMQLGRYLANVRVFAAVRQIRIDCRSPGQTFGM